MNSALQCLSNIPKLTEKILSFGNEINAPIIGAYSALIKTMWLGEDVTTEPSFLLLNISENLPRFQKYRQQDAQEFMNHFLHIIHQKLTNEKTLITDLFYGRIQSNVKCLGGCHSIDTNEELISFLPLPVENDNDQYDILYLRSNGEQELVSVHTCGKTINTLIESFIKQHETKLSGTRIQAFRIVDNMIMEKYSSYTLLSDTIKHQLSFIEHPENTIEQRYVELRFLNHETHRPFRPPIFLVRPSYDCCYSDLSEQINYIQKHLCSVTGAPTSAFHLYWITNSGSTWNFEIETHKHNSRTKIDTYIDFPLQDPDLRPYIIQKDDQKTNILTLYHLVAVCNHTGSLVSGHYFTYARNDRNKKWYSFNDDTIREIHNENDIVTKNAYILVYVQQATL
ncbi:unnamed protein product [Rotaria sp. Silwood2]|nr:unnamed protein product [Rotaria sp. Silwood2]CAF2516423.1 unnamed protein product [Rotaria sp. Silwood2]CAF2911306.1 unnamed protein product [Rotaria sp. Silwood2]CAF4247741.1 unnamed protein product [Rotaria sp. Silwood2]CAF4285917.1 unnamed protein product [Rotaria sp. Silwood2]